MKRRSFCLEYINYFTRATPIATSQNSFVQKHRKIKLSLRHLSVRAYCALVDLFQFPRDGARLVEAKGDLDLSTCIARSFRIIEIPRKYLWEWKHVCNMNMERRFLLSQPP